MPDRRTLPTLEEVRASIRRIRCKRVVLAEDLALFYGKSVSAFNQAVGRNEALFEGYRFQLTDDEVAALESQSVIAKPSGRGGRRVNPWVYTDYGVAIASNLFRRDPRAIRIMRMVNEAFVDAANSVAAPAAEILPPAPPPLLPDGDRLRALAESILDSGRQSLVDYVASPTTRRQQAVAAIMKTLAETASEDVRTRQEQLRLGIAERLARGDYRDDDDRRTLLDLLQAMK